MPTPGREDYLKQIYLLTEGGGETRIKEVAAALSVQASAASKMAKKLGEAGYLKYEKYGRVSLTDEGHHAGKEIVEKNRMLAELLRQLDVPEDRVAAEAEGMEHHISMDTIRKLRYLARGIRSEFSVRNDGGRKESDKQ